MGKTKQKVVQLTPGEIRQICEEAVDRGIAKYIDSREMNRRKRGSGLLHNTKVLLENYRKLKAYIENAASSLEEIAEDNVPGYYTQALEVFGLTIEDRRSYSVAKGVATTTILMNHVDRMLEVYKEDCRRSTDPVMQRRWEVIDRMYLREQKMSIKDIAQEFYLDPRAVQKDALKAREDLKVLIFGVDGIVDDLITDFQ